MENAVSSYSLNQLVERCLNGDREAFGEIVRKYQGLVGGFTFGMTGDFHKSEDFAQETFLIAWTKLAELKDTAKLPQWLCGIARNLIRHEKSRTFRKPEALSMSPNGVDTAFDLAAGSDSPVNQAISREHNQLVNRALNRIPEKYRIPLIMSIRSEKSTAEIALALDLTEVTLYQRITRAKKYLRKELEKQVEGAIRNSGPGELFSLAVLAALPVAVNMEWPTKAALSSAVFAAGSGNTSCTAGGCSGSSCVVSYSLGGFVKAIMAGVAFVLSWALLVIGATPAVWYSIRNAPTLRARRALILTSLRMHFLFGFFSLLYFFIREMGNIAIYMVPYHHLKPFFPHTDFFNEAFSAAMTVIAFSMAGIMLLALFLGRYSYRRILRTETGLVASNDTFPLEESRLSLKRIRRFHCISGMVLLVFFLLVLALFPVGFQVDFARGYTLNVCGMQAWEYLLRNSKIIFVIAGVVYLAVFWSMHRRFISMARDEEAFRAAPAIGDEKTSLRSRVFIEWTVCFGIYLVVPVMIILADISFWGMLTRSPFLFFWFLILLISLSISVVLINIKWPFIRPVMTILALAGLVVMAYLSLYHSLMLSWAKSGLYPFCGFFDTPQSWPLVFAVMILTTVIFYAGIVALVLGVLFVRAKSVTKARFPGRKSIFVVFGLGIVLILMISPMYHVKAQRSYAFCHFLGRRDADPGSEHAKKMLTFLDILAQNNDAMAFFALRERGGLHLKTGEYDQAIDNLTEELVWLDERNKENTVLLQGFSYLKRGLAKLGKGDDSAAMIDLKRASENPEMDWNREIPYHLGYACERQGDIETAMDYYRSTIAHLEQFQDPPPVLAMFQRPESSTVLTCNQNGFIGYEISLEQMRKIRDSLQRKLPPPPVPED